MTVYVPYTKFINGGVKYEIASMESHKCTRLWGDCIEYCGMLYNDNFYTCEEGARAYINKDYGTAEQFRFRDFKERSA